MDSIANSTTEPLPECWSCTASRQLNGLCMTYQTWGKMQPEEQAATLEQAELYLQQIEQL